MWGRNYIPVKRPRRVPAGKLKGTVGFKGLHGYVEIFSDTKNYLVGRINTFSVFDSPNGTYRNARFMA